MKKFFKDDWQDTKLLFRNLPVEIVVAFTISIIVMNILANKTIFESDVIAIDGGIIVSWVAFLCMDVITKHFGPKASTKVSLFSIFVGVIVFVLFYLVSLIPTKSDFSAFNMVIGGTWFILLSSVVAMLVSFLINIFLNWSLGKFFINKNKPRLEFFLRSYVSTFVAQFVDNFVFALLTFMLFAPIFWDGFSWTFIQCLTCSLLGAVLELLMEVVFSPIGYKIVLNWQKNNVGENYFKGVKKWKF